MEATGSASRSRAAASKKEGRERWCSFQMPLHYPKLTRADYEAMAEEELDRLLAEYGLPISGDLHHKRSFAMGAFLWASSTHLLPPSVSGDNQ